MIGWKLGSTAQTLAKNWSVSETEAVAIADRLVEVGFFEPRGNSDQPQYWVPFLYRDALDMVQGSAE